MRSTLALTILLNRPFLPHSHLQSDNAATAFRLESMHRRFLQHFDAYESLESNGQHEERTATHLVHQLLRNETGRDVLLGAVSS